jgi:hypothetical protein
MAPDTQSIDLNAIVLTLGLAIWHPLESPIDDPGDADRETLSAAIRRVDPDEDDEDPDIEDEDDEYNDDEDEEDDEYEDEDEDEEDEELDDDFDDEEDHDDEDEDEDDIKLI